jgi:DMSO reductase anchor subunit
VKPALSIILFTTIAGAAQGLIFVLAAASLWSAVPANAMPFMLWTATAMLVAALIASFFHLGHPLRAWRAMLMWRTSWMSREVIVLPLFICLVAGWAALATFGGGDQPAPRWLLWLAIIGAIALWFCTAMIYACIRFIQEWAHPLTIVNYMTLGLASGLVTAGFLGVLAGDGLFTSAVVVWAVAAIVLAWLTRILSLRRNARLKPASTTQSATGIRSARVVQKSMGMTAGSFNTREFFHGASARFYRHMRTGFQVLAFALPLLLLCAAAWTGWTGAWLLAFASQAVGLLAERWFFFAQARHPQNIYYQAVS